MLELLKFGKPLSKKEQLAIHAGHCHCTFECSGNECILRCPQTDATIGF